MQENKKFKTSRKEVTKEELLVPYNLLIEASLGDCLLDSEGNPMTSLKQKGISGVLSAKKGIKHKALKKFKNDILNIAQSYYDVIIKGKKLEKEIVKNPTIGDRNMNEKQFQAIMNEIGQVKNSILDIKVQTQKGSAKLDNNTKEQIFLDWYEKEISFKEIAEIYKITPKQAEKAIQFKRQEKGIKHKYTKQQAIKILEELQASI